MEQICRKCGQPLENGAKFCGSCGEQVFSGGGTAQNQSVPGGQSGNMAENQGIPGCGQPGNMAGDQGISSGGQPGSQGIPNGSQPGAPWNSNNGQPGRYWSPGSAQQGEPWRQPPQYGSQDRGDNTKVVMLAIGCATVLIVAAVIVFLFKDSLFGGKERREFPVSQGTEAISEGSSAAEETETETEGETESRETEADLDGVHNRNSIISGKLYYTDSTETPFVILEAPLSVYANSTSGEQVFFEAVSDIYFGEYGSFTSEELLRYDGAEVDVSGSIWAEGGKVFIDVQKLYGEPKEKETEEKTADYIIPDSDSKMLTDADVAGLSLKEINYAKNEIYARHGRRFDSKELQNYFNSKEWYDGRISPADFSERVFNRYEKKNSEFLARKEESMQRGGYKLDQ